MADCVSREPVGGCFLLKIRSYRRKGKRLTLTDSSDRQRTDALAVLDGEINQCLQCREAVAGFVKPPPLFRGVIAPVMIVGQGPGQAEVALGRPFAGLAGRRLDGWLVQAGADRAAPRKHVYLTSLTKCTATELSSSDLAKMVRECRHFLATQIRLVRPQVLITLGKVAYDDLRFMPSEYNDAVCQPLRASDTVLVNEFDFDFTLLPWPHPSGLNRQLNDESLIARLEGSMAVVTPWLAQAKR